MQAKALYDCEGDDDAELSFKVGDLLENVTKMEEEGWLSATLVRTSKVGLVPSNYVEFLPAEQETKRASQHQQEDVVTQSKARDSVDHSIQFTNRDDSASTMQTVSSQANDIEPTASAPQRKIPAGARAIFPVPGGAPNFRPIPRAAESCMKPSSTDGKISSSLDHKGTESVVHSAVSAREAPMPPPRRSAEAPTVPKPVPSSSRHESKKEYYTFMEKLRQKNPFVLSEMNDTNAYSIPEEQQTHFKNLFKMYDEDRVGYLRQSQIEDVFTKSGLDGLILGSIMMLSDLDCDGMLDESEFVLAMFLIDEKLRGKSVPFGVPYTCIPPNKRELMS